MKKSIAFLMASSALYFASPCFAQNEALIRQTGSSSEATIVQISTLNVSANINQNGENGTLNNAKITQEALNLSNVTAQIWQNSLVGTQATANIDQKGAAGYPLSPQATGFAAINQIDAGTAPWDLKLLPSENSSYGFYANYGSNRAPTAGSYSADIVMEIDSVGAPKATITQSAVGASGSILPPRTQTDYAYAHPSASLKAFINAAAYGGTSEIVQIGQDNEALIESYSDAHNFIGQSGYGLYARILSNNGSDNRNFIRQVEATNSIADLVVVSTTTDANIDQNGDNQRADLYVAAYDSSVNVSQMGDSNTIDASIDGVTGDYTISQEGDNNDVDVEVDNYWYAEGSNKLDVSQFGRSNYASVNILNYAADSVFSITQIGNHNDAYIETDTIDSIATIYQNGSNNVANIYLTSAIVGP